MEAQNQLTVDMKQEYRTLEQNLIINGGIWICGRQSILLWLRKSTEKVLE